MTALWPVVNELIRFEIELYNALDARLRADHGLTLGRFETMQVVASTGPCRVQDVADGMSISVGGASKMVDRLEASGHCLRLANPGDRRSSLLELTPDGEQALAGMAATVEMELTHRLAAVVPAKALREFGRTLKALRTRSASPKEQ